MVLQGKSEYNQFLELLTIRRIDFNRQLARQSPLGSQAEGV